jgi:hypothetical protein
MVTMMDVAVTPSAVTVLGEAVTVDVAADAVGISNMT